MRGPDGQSSGQESTKEVRRSLSKARQVLASDRCGISVICKLCRRAGLMQREEMTWLSWPRHVFVPGTPGQVKAGIQIEKLHSSRCHQPPMHPFHHKAIFTSWLLPETIRSPLVPSTLVPSMSSPSPNPTAALGQREVNESEPYPVLIYKIKTAFTDLNFISVVCMHVWKPCMRYSCSGCDLSLKRQGYAYMAVFCFS